MTNFYLVKINTRRVVNSLLDEPSLEVTVESSNFNGRIAAPLYTRTANTDVLDLLNSASTNILLRSLYRCLKLLRIERADFLLMRPMHCMQPISRSLLEEL
jgi:hypothetical protein